MTYKLLNLGTSKFLNSEVIQHPSSVEALNFISQNILVFEKTIFQTVFAIMNKLDTILLPVDGKWIKKFYFTNVAISVSDSSIDFHVRNAIIVQCICEILAIYKYVYLERNEDPIEIPSLPASNDMDITHIPKFYMKDVDAKMNMYVQAHS